MRNAQSLGDSARQRCRRSKLGSAGRAVALAAVVTLAASSPAAAQVPEQIVASDGALDGRPIWISVERLRSGGPEDLPEPWRQDLEEAIALAKARKSQRGAVQPPAFTTACDRTVLVHEHFHSVPLMSDPREVAEKADSLVVGRVTAVRQGLFTGGIGSLYELTLEQPIQGERGQPRRLLLFYRWSQLEIDGVVLCARPERGGDPPEMGARVLLALERPLFDPLNHRLGADVPIVAPAERSIFYQNRQSALSVPRGFSAGVADFAALVAAVRETFPVAR